MSSIICDDVLRCADYKDVQLDRCRFSNPVITIFILLRPGNKHSIIIGIKWYSIIRILYGNMMCTAIRLSLTYLSESAYSNLIIL